MGHGRRQILRHGPGGPPQDEETLKDPHPEEARPSTRFRLTLRRPEGPSRRAGRKRLRMRGRSRRRPPTRSVGRRRRPGDSEPGRPLHGDDHVDHRVHRHQLVGVDDEVEVGGVVEAPVEHVPHELAALAVAFADLLLGLLLLSLSACGNRTSTASTSAASSRTARPVTASSSTTAPSPVSTARDDCRT